MSGNVELERNCQNCGKHFREPVFKTLIESSTLLPNGSMMIEKASDVLVSPCCLAMYNLYQGDSDEEVGAVSAGLSRSDFEDPFAE